MINIKTLLKILMLGLLSSIKVIVNSSVKRNIFLVENVYLAYSILSHKFKVTQNIEHFQVMAHQITVIQNLNISSKQY